MDPRFTHIRDWIFDLDNCLYPASTGLFALIDERMTAYIERLLDVGPEEARRVQKHHFLEEVHDVPLDRVKGDDRLARLLPRLPGRRFVFTNGDAAYARRVLQAIGVDEHFHEIHDIHASSYRAKPDPHGYELLCERLGIDPVHALLADDMARNLVPAKELGMATVWVDNGSERGDDGYDAAMIDYRITDVADWLASILGEAE